MGAELLDMGPYAAYVWTSYALAALVLAINVLLPLRRRKTLRRRLQEYYKANENHDETQT